MTRFLSAALLSSTIAAIVAACGESGTDVAYAGSAGGYGGVACSAYTTCGSCTPVPGCGWCFSGATGACAPDPDSCSDAGEFTWTWNQSGCPAVPAVAPGDAGASLSPDAGAPVDAQSDRAD
jgi:hypothetical protein